MAVVPSGAENSGAFTVTVHVVDDPSWLASPALAARTTTLPSFCAFRLGAPAEVMMVAASPDSMEKSMSVMPLSHDALKATGGDVMVATNPQARRARALFRELEGVDIYSAAGVATASLIKCVESGRIAKDAVVMLNITGGGEELFQAGRRMWYLKPSRVFPLAAEPVAVAEAVEALFA